MGAEVQPDRPSTPVLALRARHGRVAAVLVLAAIGAVGAGPSHLAAQAATPFSICDLFRDPVSDLAGPKEDLLRMAEISRAGMSAERGLRRPSSRLDACDGIDRDRKSPGARLGPLDLGAAPLSVAIVGNSGYPEDRNNGGLWAGRGLNSRLSVGIRIHAGILDAGLIPELSWSQNRDYERLQVSRPGYAADANPYYNDIDLPQRFGAGSFSRLGPGQSYVRVTVRNVAIGASTENVWLGPAARNPILLSNTAPGFPHAFLETTEPVDLRLVDVDLSLLYGWLHESDYFDANDANDDGRLAAWTLVIRPRGLRDLQIGFGRTWRWDPDFAPDALAARFGIDVGNEPGLGMVSLFGRFRFPASAAEAWVEWARTDPYLSIVDDLLMEPEHSQAFVAGFQKVSNSWLPLRLLGEVAHLQEKQREREGRGLPVYYTDPVVRQGHTHRGQLLGAGIGPGGDAQYVEIDALFPNGLAGVFVERLRRNEGSMFAVRERFDSYLHDTQITAGTRAEFVLDDLMIAAALSRSFRIRRDFLRDDRNLQLTMEMTWWP